jgi:ribosome maturation factor RimP
MVSITDKIADLIQPVLEDLGLELVDLEYKREQHGWTLRFFLDKEGGITLDNCADASREISSLLDVEDVIQTAYNLEVSSPGIERPLRTREHFLRFVGKQIKVKTFLPVAAEDGKKAQKTFSGTLIDVTGDTIKLQLQGRAKVELELNLDQIEKANLKFEF